MLYLLFCAISFCYCDLRFNGGTESLITSFSASGFELYGTLHVGKKVPELYTELYNGSDGTEQLCLIIRLSELG